MSCLTNFNSQPHEEADVVLMDMMVRTEHFNSQPHEEADCWQRIVIQYRVHFNSQPHEEADLAQQLVHLLMDLFQLTASRRG